VGGGRIALEGGRAVGAPSLRGLGPGPRAAGALPPPSTPLNHKLVPYAAVGAAWAALPHRPELVLCLAVGSAGCLCAAPAARTGFSSVNCH